MSLEKLQNLAVSFLQDGDETFTANLTWTAIRTYDKIIVAWGPGDSADSPSPSSVDLGGSATSYSIKGVPANTSFVFKVEGATRVDIVFTVDWQHSGFIAVVALTPDSSKLLGATPQLLFYSRSRPKVNNAFLAAFYPHPQKNNVFDVDSPVQIGGWERDWKAVTLLELPDGKRLLLHRDNGQTFSARLWKNGPGVAIDGAKPVDNWAADWTQITSFTFLGETRLLFYRAALDGFAFIATVSPSGDGVSVGQLAFVGHWEQDWIQVKALKFNNEAYIVLYRPSSQDGHLAFAAHVIVREGRIDVDTAVPIGLPAGLKLITPLSLPDGRTYLLLYRNDGVPFVSQVIASAKGIDVTPPFQIANGWEADWSEIVYLPTSGLQIHP